MDLQLAGRRALVTGASGAIGEAIAIGLAAERASVIVQGRRSDAVGRVVEAITASGVTVNTVSPGIVATPGVESFFSTEAVTRGWGTSWPEIEAGVIRDVLPNSIGRLARVGEVADLVAFLASPRAGAITGANYRIDGGSTTSIN